MDNDREVNSLVSKTKGLFLKELGREFQDRQKRYDLDEEFSKTKKNRSPFVMLVVVGITAVLALVSILIAVSIEQAAENMDVGISNAFADVNLKDVLDTVKRNEADMEQAQRMLQELLQQRDTALNAAQQSADQDIRLIQSSDLSRAAMDRQIAAVQNRLPLEIEAVHREFDPQIAEAEARIAEIQTRLDQYDARQLQLAREQEERLYAQQRLYELEREQILARHQAELDNLNTQYSEQIRELQRFSNNLEANLNRRFQAEKAAALADQKLIYNPVFSGPAQAAIAGAPSNPAGVITAPTLSAEAARYTGAEFSARLSAAYQKLEVIFDRLSEVPYENSVPTAFSAIQTDVLHALRVHREAQDVLARTVEDYAAELATLEELSGMALTILDGINYSLGEMSRINGDSGYIVDPRNPEDIMVFIANPDLLSLGMIGIVYREDSRQIGTVRITKLGSPSYASVVSLSSGETLAPYDSLIFNFQGASASSTQ